MVVFIHVDTKSLAFLRMHGFVSQPLKTGHEITRLEGMGVSCVLYASGKLLIQGKQDAVAKVSTLFLKQGFTQDAPVFELEKETGWVIGSDETLKGDTFGGIVVAAVKADAAARTKLLEMGVNDSKKLRDEEMVPLARKIKEVAACEVRSILPEEYNAHTNQTLLLNRLHKECAVALGSGTHIVDKFPGCLVGDVIEEKADSRYLEVAAASIIARVAGLEQLRFISGRAGFIVPKGSTHVHEALEMVRKKGLDPTTLVKMNFRNVKDVFE